MPGFAFFRPEPEIGDVVEALWDADIPDPDAARAIAIRVLPSVSPTLCVHYRAPTGSSQRINPGSCRQRITGVQTVTATMRPTGPVGALIIHLRPEVACRLVGDRMNEFTDANIALSDLFHPGEVSLLEEGLLEAKDSRARAERMQAFLRRRLRDNAADVLVSQAMRRLRHNPNVPVRRLASELDISERQLSRRFHTAVGINLKQFARLLRFGKAVAARRRGWRWAEIAFACGFSDQAHMIHDFTLIAGAAPEALVGMASEGKYRDLNAGVAAWGFSNTLITSPHEAFTSTKDP